ncbi:MAG TPA: hypothetical protein VM487_21070 [Phycisphaerae bacterium]|nr:hypothetical protein [Phycisphaerae bacterium]
MWQPIGLHPFASYTTTQDAYGQFVILMRCGQCGDHHQRTCHQPARMNEWLMHYAAAHAHGLQPQLR